MGLFTETGRVLISPSRLRAWRDCELRWHAVYVEGREIVPTPSMAFGKAMHSALEAFHKGRWLGRPVPLDGLEGIFDETLRHEAEAGDLDLGSQQATFEKAARGLLGAYLERFATEEVAGAELHLSAPLTDASGQDLGADLVGILDLVADGRVIDLKTAARASDGFSVTLAHQVQLEAYRYLLAACAPDLSPTGAAIRTLIRTREPRITEQPVPLRAPEAFLDLCRAYIDAVHRTAVPTPRPGLLCNATCPAYAACRAHHGLEAA
jgi:putative RecB family exonuclease